MQARSLKPCWYHKGVHERNHMNNTVAIIWQNNTDNPVQTSSASAGMLLAPGHGLLAAGQSDTGQCDSGLGTWPWGCHPLNEGDFSHRSAQVLLIHGQLAKSAALSKKGQAASRQRADL